MCCESRGGVISKSSCRPTLYGRRAVSDDGGPSNSLGTVERPVLYGGGQELRGGPSTSERPTVAEWRRQASMEEHAVARVRERDPRCMVMVGHDRAVWLLGCCFSASWAALDSSWLGCQCSVADPRTPPPMLLCGGGAQWATAGCAAPASFSCCTGMVAVGHDGGPRGSPGPRKRLTLLGCGRPRWRTMR